MSSLRENVGWWGRCLEARRRAERAEAECAALRELLGRVARELDAVPEKDARTVELIEEAGRQVLLAPGHPVR